MQRSWNLIAKLANSLFLREYHLRPTIKPLRFRVSIWSTFERRVCDSCFYSIPLEIDELDQCLCTSTEVSSHKPLQNIPLTLSKAPMRIPSSPLTVPPPQSSNRAASNSTPGRTHLHGSGRCGTMHFRQPCVYPVTKTRVVADLFPLGRFWDGCHAWATFPSRAVGYGRARTSLYSVFKGIRL